MEAHSASVQLGMKCSDSAERVHSLSRRSSIQAARTGADSKECQGAAENQEGNKVDNSSSDSGNMEFSGSAPVPVRLGSGHVTSEPQRWRSFVRCPDQQQQQEQLQLHGQDQKLHERRKGIATNPPKNEADGEVILREACLQDLPFIEKLMKRHLRSLILPAVFYWLCCNAQDFGSFLAICCCFASFSRVLLSLLCFLLLLLVRVVLELEQYAAKGCPDLANFEPQYLKADRNRFWVAEKRDEGGTHIIGCIGLIIHQASPQDGQLVRLVVSPGHRGVGVGSQLLSAALGFAASCRCRSVEVCANSLNASSARFLRNRQFELVQVVKRNLMRGDLLRWRLSFDSEGRPIEPKPEFTFGGGDLQPE